LTSPYFVIDFQSINSKLQEKNALVDHRPMLSMR